MENESHTMTNANNSSRSTSDGAPSSRSSSNSNAGGNKKPGFLQKLFNRGDDSAKKTASQKRWSMANRENLNSRSSVRAMDQPPGFSSGQK